MLHNRTTIINTALMRVAAPGATSPDEDSQAAQHANAAYDRARDLCLASYPWTFAAKFKALEQLAEASVPNLKSYTLPPDCLRVIGVSTLCYGQACDDYILAGKALHSRHAGLVLHYVSADATQTFPDHFADALAWRIALEISPHVEQGAVNAKTYLEMHEFSLDQAKVHNDAQAPASPTPSAYLQERFG
ncbi:hypothetical protein [Desulfovibrio intestinalis]|uniref:Uncharacterized protein n=1 Tax=Desulfovibrio intestinalis TaxID=58621 RepID=A0A7W8C458_9BACT|nr:hypothetical protein [Desulfovibrio intestinalis]MBB5143954.1 hypothetical protein [Desulfovibrio intestinalis]